MTERNVLVVDWSANSKPKTGADSIWIGDAYGNRVNPPTRLEAIRFLKDVVALGGDDEKWLIAFDFSFGVPCWGGCARCCSCGFGVGAVPIFTLGCDSSGSEKETAKKPQKPSRNAWTWDTGLGVSALSPTACVSPDS